MRHCGEADRAEQSLDLLLPEVPTLTNASASLDLIWQLIAVAFATREVLGQQSSRTLDALSEALGEFAFAESGAHQGGEFAPECIATLRVNALVSDDGEIARARRDEEEDAVALLGGAHVEQIKLLARSGHGVGALAMRDEDPDLTRGALLCCLNGAEDGFVPEFEKEPPVIHRSRRVLDCLPVAACAPAAEGPASTTEATG